MFIFHLIDIIGSYFTDAAMFTSWFMPMICLSFIATVPFILCYFLRR